MTFLDLITEDVIKVPLVSTTKPAVLRELVQILKDAGKTIDFDAALGAILEREEKQSTGLEKGIAVPHGKTASVKSLVTAIGVSKEGIEFNAIDGKPTNLFFLLIAPPNMPGPHVEALAEIARLSRSPAFCNALINARTPREVVDLLKDE